MSDAIRERGQAAGVVMGPWGPVAAAIFDMDGLLIDSEPLWQIAIASVCQRRGGAYTDADVGLCQGRGLRHTVEHLLIKHEWPRGEGGGLEAEIGDEMCRLSPGAPDLPGVRELLGALRGRVPLGLASSSPEALVRASVGGRPYFGWFAAVVSGDRVARPKPAPDVFLEAARRLGAPPERCLAFEDSRAGCESARAAGMRVVAVPAGPHKTFEPVADLVVSSLAEVVHELGLSDLASDGVGA
ncbi:MAG TPA: HAD family phosphatase [Polyangiaceae bacterium]|nr:HAD family phosphatase [Polyangiaceae bacterium]